MAKLFANNGDPDQTPRSAASYLGLHFCQLPFYGSPDYNGLRVTSNSASRELNIYSIFPLRVIMYFFNLL